MREGGKPAFSARAQTAERPSNPRMQQPFVALSRRRRSLSISPSLTDWHGNTDVEGYMRESAAEEAAVSPFFSWWISIRLLSSSFLLPSSLSHSLHCPRQQPLRPLSPSLALKLLHHTRSPASDVGVQLVRAGDSLRGGRDGACARSRDLVMVETIRVLPRSICTLCVIPLVVIFCGAFLTCSTGRWADTAATVQPNW